MKLDFRTFSLLVIPPAMWAGNAVVGRLLVASLPPVTMNALRWLLVALLLLPLAWRVLLRPGQVAQRWVYLALIGMLGVGSYNALQYMALRTSTPLNATLIGASVPVWMMLVGRVAYGQALHARQLAGALLSMAGVLLVISQGQWQVLRDLRLVPGDLLMLLASLAWALYSWMLVRPPASMSGDQRPRWDWAAFLWIQVMFGLIWAAACSGVEWALLLAPNASGADAALAANFLTGQAWTFKAVLGLVFIAIGPSIWAYRSWGLGVQAVGPTMAAFFGNLTPVFAALWSAVLLGQRPQWFHPCAFVLIAVGIFVSSRAGRARGGTGTGGPGSTR